MFVKSNTLQATKAYFQERLENLFSEHELRLMFHVLCEERLHLSKSEILLGTDIRLSESDLLYFRAAVKRLQQNEPFQYIVGKTEFFGLEIYCDNRALIPRPETEELVEWILDTTEDKQAKIMDLCSGTGCIAFALKSNLPGSEVYALEFSEDALTLANQNATALGLQVSFVQGDALSEQESFVFDEKHKESFDVWVSNPPYIPFKQKEEMKENVLAFEPHLALFVENDDALLFYRSIAEKALFYLKNGGFLFFELNEYYAEETAKLMHVMGYAEVEIKEDLQGKKRMLRARL
jgi:release factor glutamine methyltransferase